MVFSVTFVAACPSGGKWEPEFEKKGEWWYDKPWGVNRNSAYNLSIDEEGYIPALAYESSRPNTQEAYLKGEWFINNYPSRRDRAEAILDFVQQWTQYVSDINNLWVQSWTGEPQEEFSCNADEMMHMMDLSTNTPAVGDCEDLAFLCALIYMSADFDVAIVDAPQHVALLIYFPEYPNANMYWNIDKAYTVPTEYGIGWIWVEATGNNNPLGWTPPDFIHGGWDAHPLTIKMDIRYLAHSSRAFGSYLGDAMYNPGYDIDKNKKIDIFDIAFAVQYWDSKVMPLRMLRAQSR